MAEAGITVVGAGSGERRHLTAGAREAIADARVIVAGGRFARMASDEAETFIIGSDLERVRDFIDGRLKDEESVCVITSGDPGCFSILPFLKRSFPGRVRVVPGISSVQLLAARLELPWQDWRLVSLHGRGGVVELETPRGPTLYFCDAANSPAAIARELLGRMEDCPAVAAAGLGRADERLVEGGLADIAGSELAADALLLVRPPADGGGEAAVPGAWAPGIPDGLWLRVEGIPMSKSEARSVLMGKVQPRGRGVIWDVGAGTGCYSVECSLLEPSARVIAVDRKEEACGLVRENARRFGARVETVQGDAPSCLAGLPAPDLVIIGGNDGRLEEIFEVVTGVLRPGGRVAVTAVLERTRRAAHGLFAASGLARRAVTRVAIARGREKEWDEHNPVLIFTGDRE